jgi:hypothetical protein
MPKSQSDFLMKRKDAIYNPDKKPNHKEKSLNARQLRRLEQKLQNKSKHH